MEREDILKSPEFWTTKTQIALYNCAMKFMKEKNFDRTRLADYLGVSKGYVTQLLNGDYDHRMSKFFELALSFGVIPIINFTPIEKYIELENHPKIFETVKVESSEIKQWNDSTKYSYKTKLSSYNQIYKKVA